MTTSILDDVEASKKHWLHTPLTRQWEEGAKLEDVVESVEALLDKWTRCPTSPFSPDVDAAALDTMDTLRQAGVFWFNNGILPPDEEAGNWPFHLKEVERWAVRAKAERVGLRVEQTAGYVCKAGEAHAFCIRAARQDMKQAMPHAPVTLIAGVSAHPGVESAADMLGLRMQRVKCGRLGEMDMKELDGVLEKTVGAVIVVATWRNMMGGGFDDLQAISERLCARRRQNGLLARVHLDAVRCFDDVTTLSNVERVRLGLPRVVVDARAGHKQEKEGEGEEVVVRVSTVAAGGANLGGVGTELAVALKPRGLGLGHGEFIECVAGSDDTISGSRDALAGALVALHEARFGGAAGLRQVYQQCRLLRDAVAARLAVAQIPVRMDARGLDMVVEAGPFGVPPVLFGRWAARRLADGAAMLAFGPGCSQTSVDQLLAAFGIAAGAARGLQLEALPAAAPAAMAMTAQLKHAAAQWRRLSPRSCGYPGDHSTLSVLGPLIARASSTPWGPEPAAWTAARQSELLHDTCAALGVDVERATAAFTSGSTASNRIGILTALSVLPHATLYASAAAHYSVAKIAADHDGLRNTAVVNVPTDPLGCMVPGLLARSIARDMATAASENRPFAAVLFVTAGTTFSGATDDIPALCAAAATVNARIDYVHLDGALNLGATMAPYTLGPPGSHPIHPATGRHVVQSVSVSHHKFPGLSVAGQVVCWKPACGPLAAHHDQADRRVVFELWLYRRLVSQHDRDALYAYCLANAQRLRSRLKHADIKTLSNPASLVTLVRRQPVWLIDHFNLSPEGEWVHFITMPHVTSSVVDEFVDAVADHAAAVTKALIPLHRHVAQLFARETSDVSLKLLHDLDQPSLASVSNALYSSRITSPAKQLEQLRFEWTNSTLCFAAVDTSKTLLAAILCQVSRDRAVQACAVLTQDSLPLSRDLLSLANTLVGSLYTHNIVTTQSLSVECITFASLSPVLKLAPRRDSAEVEADVVAH